MTVIEIQARFADLEPLAVALAGRPVVLRAGSLQSPGYTDGSAIYIPDTGAGADLIAVIVAQSLFLRVGPVPADILARLAVNKPLAARYFLLEVVRATRLYRWLVPRQFAELSVIADFPAGSRSPVESLRLAASSQSLPALPVSFGCLRPMSLLRAAATQMISGQHQTPQHHDEQQQLNDALEKDRQQLEDGESSSLLNTFSNNGNSNGMTQSLLEKLLGAGSGQDESQDEGFAAGEMEIGRVEKITKKSGFAKFTRLLGLEQAGKASGALDESGSRRHLYPEWDYRRRCFQQDWTWVDEVEPWNEFPLQVQDYMRPASAFLLRQLSGIGLAYEWHDGEVQGDELLIDRVVDQRISQLAGFSLRPAIYRAARKTERDMGVLVLLDVSGSTAENSSDTQSGAGDDPGSGATSVFIRQCQLAYELVDAFERVGDHVGLYGFHSRGRKNVRFLRIKSFRECLGSQVNARFDALDPCAYTRTGAAIRHATKVLKTETRLNHRLLIVISDSYIYDDGYEQEYAEADTRMALAEARAEGTACVCLSIGSQREKERMAAVFGSGAALCVDNHNQFLKNIRSVILASLKTLA